MNIVCIDTETTGLSKSTDRVIQLSMQKFDAETGETIMEKDWYIKPTGNWKMEPTAQAVHGISKEFIEENGVSLKSIFDEIMEMIDECPILTYNGTSFDIAFLQREFEREGLEAHLDTHKYIDAFDIEKRMNSHKLADVYRRLFGEDFEDAHNSMADVRATTRVYLEQVKRYDEVVIKESIDSTTQHTQISPEGFVTINEEGTLVFNVGKYKLHPVAEVCKKDPGYIKWLFTPNNGDNVITNITKRAIKKDYYAQK